ncbi:MAG: hypothetical protein E7307_05540 [Butyrivibrio sp.]|nr:hypothetical protein [Butyrivibrio sp.]
MEKNNSNNQYPNRKKNSETFLIKVTDCQNGSWQGKVVWADKERAAHFRSALELIKLMDEVVSEGTMEDRQYYQQTAT